MPTRIPSELRRAYEQAVYCVYTEATELELQIGLQHPALDALLASHKVSAAAFITACNPASAVLSDADNDVRHARLVADVQASGLSYLHGEGRDPAGQWQPEQSLLILGIKQTAAAELAARYGQNACVFLASGCAPQLV
jgi:hypothetical protein